MRNTRFAAGAVLSSALLALCLTAVPAAAGDAAEALEQAIGLFNDGDYLAAQELLLGIDRTQLTPEQQGRRDDYVSRVEVAITMHEKALRDLEDGETAIAEREYDRADRLLNAVLANEYAAEALRRSARTHLRDLQERSALIEESTGAAAAPAGATAPQALEAAAETVPPPPAREAPPTAPAIPADLERARVLTQEGHQMVKAGRIAEAERRFQEALKLAPGYPEAVDGLEVARQHAENVTGTRGESLIERIRRDDAINWQRSVARYRDAERIIRGHVLAERFDEANQILVRARQIVESGKQFADPITKYENLRSEVEALTKYVRAEERVYDERTVAETRREIEEVRRKQLREVEESRARQVDTLMQQAMQHRKDGDLDAAINVLRQVVVIDPKHSPARWLMDSLEDLRHFRQARETRDLFYDKSRAALEEVERAKIPWYEEITYPKDWLEIISREERNRPGESRRDRQLFGALDRQIPVDFRREPFDQVIERFADAHRINFIVNWNDLQRVGVERSTPIDLSLPNGITLKRALTEVLEQAGEGVVDLGYDVSDGAITIASQDFLSKKTYPVVYDIRDLLVGVPQFPETPTTGFVDRGRRSSRVSEEADLPWQYGDDDDDEPEANPERTSRIRQLVELIRDTIAPDSWRENGGSIGTISEINGQLVITQNSAVHGQIKGLLDRLREERSVQIAVEATFITVSSHYLEELGLDLDILLNAGSAGYDFLPGAGGGGTLTDPVLGQTLLLPRTFSRLGIVPNPLGVGQAMGTGDVDVLQPFAQPYLVPPTSGASGSRMTPVPLTSNILDFTNPANLASDVPGSFAGQSIGPALSIFGSFLDNIQVDFLIRATQADSRSSVVTAPRLVVLNGEFASIAVTIQQHYVAELEPVVAQQAVAQRPETGVIDSGASLIVEPVVTPDRRYVIMALAPGVSRLLDLQSFLFAGGAAGGAANPAFIQLPTRSVQLVKTVVSVPDGATLLIGGQKLASETEVESGVPILSKIPILKRIYSSRAMVKDEQTLLILIKPKILIQSEQEELAFPSFARG